MPYYSSIAAAEADGLIHYWPMNEPTGDTVADIIGGWNGQLVGVNAPPSATDIANSIVSAPSGLARDLGARFTGTSEDLMPIELLTAPSRPTYSALTVRIRFFLTSEIFTNFSSWAPFGIGHNSGSVFLGQYQSFGLEYNYGSRSGTISGANPFTVGVWHDLLISADGSGAFFYLDGVEIFSGAGATVFDIYEFNGSGVAGWIGARTTTTLNESGARADIVVQDFAVWNRALTPTEMAALDTAGHTEELTPPPPVDVSFDVTAPITPSFVAYSTGYSGFVVSAPITANFEMFQDWTQALNSLLLQESYQMIITGQEDGLDDLTVPISNWQATNQSGGRRAYLQAVIPGAQQYISEISARSNGSLVIRQGFRLPSGESQFSEIMRSDFDSLRYDRSGNRFTVTVSGRKLNETPATGARTLKGIRTISVTDGNRRVRCDIDLFLRPGMTVIADTEEFTADYINYFVTTNDKFCEVSER